MTVLYPEIEPYDSGMLPVGDGHEIYWETSGNPYGEPMIFFHGGPGSHSTPFRRQFYDPDKYKIILYHQRGAGKSTPHASLENNTTPHLVSDIEKLREYLAIDEWHLSGGSWGGTLALAYAESYPECVKSLTIQGVFLARQKDLEHLYFSGGTVSREHPKEFERFMALLPEEDYGNPIEGYHKLFNHPDEEIRERAIYEWSYLEASVVAVKVTPERIAANMTTLPEHSLFENHYHRHNGFVDMDKILESLGEKLADIPVNLVHGRSDMVCPLSGAKDLHRAIPHSQLHIIDDAGHSVNEPGNRAKLVEIYDGLVDDIAIRQPRPERMPQNI